MTPAERKTFNTRASKAGGEEAHGESEGQEEGKEMNEMLPTRGVIITGGRPDDDLGDLSLEELQRTTLCMRAIEYLIKKYGTVEMPAIRILLDACRK